jgi:predicted nucleic acid-binding protein
MSKAYWDSSALVESTLDEKLENRLVAEGGFARDHVLAEVFSSLTGNAQIRMPANDAAKTIRAMESRLEFVNLTRAELMDAMDKAQSLGVRGGAVHDYLHALAAKKSGASELLTLDRNDFNGLVRGLTITQV